MSLKLIYILLIGFSPLLQELQSQVPQPVDSTEVDIRTVDQEALTNLTDDPAFDYQVEAQNPESLLSRLRRWLFQVIAAIFNNPWASVVIKVIFFTIFGLVLAALVNQMLGGKLSSGFGKSRSPDPVSLNIRSHSIFDTQYEKLLDSAISERRYRDAVRILYIMALKQLNEGDLIVWKADKTNHDYLSELGDHPSRIPFDQLTTYYEYVEYGDFAIEESGYERVQSIYQNFRKQAVPS